MFAPLAFTISFALLGSLILSLTLVPMLCTVFLKQEAHEHDPVSHPLAEAHLPRLLKPCVRFPWLVVLLALAALGGSLTLVPLIGTEFLPVARRRLHRRADLPHPEHLAAAIARAADSRRRRSSSNSPKSSTWFPRRAAPTSPPTRWASKFSDVIVTLKPREEWTTTKSKEELVEKMREALAELPGVASSFSQPIALRVDELVSGVKSAIGIKIFGDDLDVLKEKGDAVARVLGKVRGAADVNVEKVSGLAYLQIEIDRDKIARYGINVADINDVIETAIGGKEATKVYEGLKVFGLAVRFPEAARNDVEPIKEILIPSPSGALIPLGQLAKVYVTEGPAQISREMGQRRIVIECNVTGPRHRRLRRRGAAENRRRRETAARLHHHLGRAIREPAARDETLRHRRADHHRCDFPAALQLVQFGEAGHAHHPEHPVRDDRRHLSRWSSAHFNLSVSASVGFIALFGVAVLNGVVMVSYFNELRRDGMAVAEPSSKAPCCVCARCSSPRASPRLASSRCSSPPAPAAKSKSRSPPSSSAASSARRCSRSSSCPRSTKSSSERHHQCPAFIFPSHLRRRSWLLRSCSP